MKHTFQLTYSTIPDVPGTAMTICEYLGKKQWSIDRCYIGEVSRVINNSSYGTYRISTSNPDVDNSEEKKGLEQALENHMKAEGCDNPKAYVDLEPLNIAHEWRFAAQIEFANQRGVVKDIIKQIYSPSPSSHHIKINRTKYICAIDGLICMPLFIRGENGKRGILDIRFRLPQVPSTSSDEHEISTDVCKNIESGLKSVSGVRKWSIVGTSPKTEEIKGFNELNDYYGHYPATRRVNSYFRYHRPLKENAAPKTGVAYATFNAIWERGFSIRKAVVTEIKEGQEFQRAGVFQVSGKELMNEKDREAILESVQNFINLKENITGSRVLPDQEIFVSGVSPNEKDYGFTHEENRYNPDRIWISCQIEIENQIGALGEILKIFNDSHNPSESKLSIEHMITMYQYKSTDNKVALIDITSCSSKSFDVDRDYDSTCRKAMQVCEWLVCSLIEYGHGINEISCKSVGIFGMENPSVTYSRR